MDELKEHPFIISSFLYKETIFFYIIAKIYPDLSNTGEYSGFMNWNVFILALKSYCCLNNPLETG